MRVPVAARREPVGHKNRPPKVPYGQNIKRNIL